MCNVIGQSLWYQVTTYHIAHVCHDSFKCVTWLRYQRLQISEALPCSLCRDTWYQRLQDIRYQRLQDIRYMISEATNIRGHDIRGYRIHDIRGYRNHDIRGYRYQRLCPVASDIMYSHAIHDITLQHTATHCNTLQHTATHCNTHYTCTWYAIHVVTHDIQQSVASAARVQSFLVVNVMESSCYIAQMVSIAHMCSLCYHNAHMCSLCHHIVHMCSLFYHIVHMCSLCRASTAPPIASNSWDRCQVACCRVTRCRLTFRCGSYD